MRTTTLMLIALLAVAAVPREAVAFGTNYGDCVTYLYAQEVSTNVPPLDSIVLMERADTAIKFTWRTAFCPSKTELEAVAEAAEVAATDERLTLAAIRARLSVEFEQLLRELITSGHLNRTNYVARLRAAIAE